MLHAPKCSSTITHEYAGDLLLCGLDDALLCVKFPLNSVSEALLKLLLPRAAGLLFLGLTMGLYALLLEMVPTAGRSSAHYAHQDIIC